MTPSFEALQSPVLTHSKARCYVPFVEQEHGHLIHPCALTCSAAILREGHRLSPENLNRVTRVADAYAILMESGDHAGVNSVTREIATLQMRPGPDTTEALDVIAQTLRNCRDILPPDPDYASHATFPPPTRTLDGRRTRPLNA